MEKKTFSPLEITDLFRSAVVARYTKAKELNPRKPLEDQTQALNSIDYFPENMGRGFMLLLNTLELDLETQLEIIANPLKRMGKGMKNDELFVNQKCIDKLVRLCQWLDGVTDDDAYQATKGNRTPRKTIMDNETIKLVVDMLKAYSVVGRFGDVRKTASFSMHELRCGLSYNYAADRAPIEADTDTERMKYYERGSADYASSTSSSQSSQMKTLLISFKMCNVEKAKKDDVIEFDLRLCKLFARVIKINQIKFNNATK